MSPFRLILRSLTFFWRTNLGVVLGAAVATAVIVGALVVGDSVTKSLEALALARLGKTQLTMATGDRFFTVELADAIASDLKASAAPVLALEGVARLPNTKLHLPVRVIGVDDRFWSMGGAPQPMLDPSKEGVCVVSASLADQLGVTLGGDDTFLLLDVAKPSALSRDIALGSETENAVRLTPAIKGVADADHFGRYSLSSSQIPPLNVFVPLSWLQREAQVEGRVNTLLVGPATAGNDAPTVEAASGALYDHWRLEDANVELRALDKQGVIDLRTTRVFLDRSVVNAAKSAGATREVLAYFVNRIATESGAANTATPYSIVAALPLPEALPPPEGAGVPSLSNPLPADMRDDEIVVTQWLADDLSLKVGDKVTLDYFVMGIGRKLDETSATFTVRAIVPTEPAGGDRELLPHLPGLADARTPLEWKPPPDLRIDLRKIRKKDEQYWDEHRGAPKAFVTLHWAQTQGHWSNPFGDVTTVRWPLTAEVTRDAVAAKLREAIDPSTLGFRFDAAHQNAIEGATKGTGSTFGELFVSLSVFLIVAALLLTGLLFVLGIEQRTTEIGTLLALGWTPRKVRYLWLFEGGALAAIGAIVGVPLGVLYTRGVLWALGALWADAVAGASLSYHASAASMASGAFGGLVVAFVTMWWVLRRQARQPARALLAARFGLESAHETRETSKKKAAKKHHGALANWPFWVGIVSLVFAMGMVAAGAVSKGGEAQAGSFFGAGALLLIGALMLCTSLLRRMARGSDTGESGAAAFTIAKLGMRNSGRRRGRSLATISMLACGAFLVVAVNAFRHDAGHDSHQRDSGTGGFSYWAQASLPIFADLNDSAVRERLGLDDDAMKDVTFVPMRLRGGDDASCLNLNKPLQPPLLGVNPESLASRGAFKFVKTSGDMTSDKPWLMLAANDAADKADEPVPAVLDASVATWILYKGVGDTLDYTDENGNPFKLRIVGTLANSILQGNIVISEKQFVRRYPSQSGYRVLLVDMSGATDAQHDAAVKAIQSSDLADQGLVMMDAVKRLAAFFAVENTYLTIFAVLGGLGLLLGSVGLGVVVARNILERRSELALMRAVGFRAAALVRLVLSEHWLLVALGLGSGVIAAAVAVGPTLASPGAQIPVVPLGVTLGLIVISALAWTFIATLLTLRGPLTDALRSE